MDRLRRFPREILTIACVYKSPTVMHTDRLTIAPTATIPMRLFMSFSLCTYSTFCYLLLLVQAYLRFCHGNECVGIHHLDFGNQMFWDLGLLLAYDDPRSCMVMCGCLEVPMRGRLWG